MKKKTCLSFLLSYTRFCISNFYFLFKSLAKVVVDIVIGVSILDCGKPLVIFDILKKQNFKNIKSISYCFDSRQYVGAINIYSFV